VVGGRRTVVGTPASRPTARTTARPLLRLRFEPTRPADVTPLTFLDRYRRAAYCIGKENNRGGRHGHPITRNARLSAAGGLRQECVAPRAGHRRGDPARAGAGDQARSARGRRRAAPAGQCRSALMSATGSGGSYAGCRDGNRST